MIHSFGTLRRFVAGSLALLIAGVTSASAQSSPAPMRTMVPKPMQTPVGKPRLRLSDTITIRPGGACWLVSDATDVEKPPEKTGPQRCVFRDGNLATAYVPGNRDEYITFQYTISANGVITGGACREGLNQGAYSCTINGQTRPGTERGGLMKSGATLRVWEIPSLP